MATNFDNKTEQELEIIFRQFVEDVGIALKRPMGVSLFLYSSSAASNQTIVDYFSNMHACDADIAIRSIIDGWQGVRFTPPNEIH